MSKNRYCGILLYSVISFLISALSFILIPFSNFEGTKLQKALAYMVGFIFWIGLIVGLILTHYLGRSVRNIIIENTFFQESFVSLKIRKADLSIF